MKSILLIIPYFGKWPVWFDAYLCSVAANPSINWLCPTDCEIPVKHPKNIAFLPITLTELNSHVNQIVEAEVPLNPRKFCDLKPAYGAVFKEEAENYDFWGVCDMDIIWGNIRFFIKNDILNKFDIISSRKGAISGHFTLFRNTNDLNEFYKTIPNYKKLFEKNRFMWFDEHILSNYLVRIDKFEKKPFNIYWPKILLNQENGIDSHQEYYLDKWQWVNGRMIDAQKGKEVMYLHFINWKRSLKTCEVTYGENPMQFYISYTGIHYKPHSKITHLFNSIKNIFNGFWVKERRRLRMNKLKSLKKKIYNKILKMLIWK